MKKFSVLAAAAAFIGNITQARMLSGGFQEEEEKALCCELFSGPIGNRTSHQIC
jgi:hypothetical protein